MKKILYILVAICLFASCEYDPSGVNFEELTPPSDFIPIEITLNDIDPADTIYVFEDTKVTVKIHQSQNNPLKLLSITLGGKTFQYSQGVTSADIVLRRNELGEGVHKLTVNATFSSGTGSLAEMMGMEGYMGEMSWNIRVMPDPATQFKVDYRLNEEGFLEIYWENSIPEDAIKNYVVRPPYITQNNIHTIDNPMQKSFVDYSYVCGQIGYEVVTNLKSGYSYSQRISINKPAPKIYFENLGPNALRVYWDKPFANGRFTLTEGNNVITLNDTTITFPQNFGKNREFFLETRPLKAEYDNSGNRFTVWDWFNLGNSLNVPDGWLYTYAYSKMDNNIYAAAYSSGFTIFDATTLSMLNQPMRNVERVQRIACAPHNSTVIAMTGTDAYIFADNQFTNPIIIPGCGGDINTRLNALTTDDRFFVVPLYVSSLPASKTCHIFNAKTGEKIFDFSFTHEASLNSANFATVSEDGRYFCSGSGSFDGMELFEINGKTANLIYSDTRRNLNAKFIPGQPDKLLLRVDTYFEIRQMPGFDLIQKFDLPLTGAAFANIDPVTGNVLYFRDNVIYVAPMNDISNPIFEMGSDDTSCVLINNKLFTHYGRYFDITPYIE